MNLRQHEAGGSRADDAHVGGLSGLLHWAEQSQRLSVAVCRRSFDADAGRGAIHVDIVAGSGTRSHGEEEGQRVDQGGLGGVMWCVVCGGVMCSA